MQTAFYATLRKKLSYVLLTQQANLLHTEFGEPRIEEKPLHLQNVTVWCAVWSGGYVWLYNVFKDDLEGKITAE